MNIDFAWLATALGDVAWLGLAFALGLLSRLVCLPLYPISTSWTV